MNEAPARLTLIAQEADDFRKAATPEEAEAAASAARRVRARPRRPSVPLQPDGSMGGGSVTTVEHLDALGTRSAAFAGAQMGALASISLARGASINDDAHDASVRTASSLALVAAVDPRDELEAAIAVQMAGTHTLALEMLTRARHSERTDQVALYGGLAVKLQRTFAGQVEALAKLRSAGKQVVEVNHVHTYVAAGGQAIIGEVHHQGGGGRGAPAAIAGQPHALAGIAVDDGSSMRSANPERGSLQGAGHGRQEEMPDARRRQPRRAPRCSEREV